MVQLFFGQDKSDLGVLVLDFDAPFKGLKVIDLSGGVAGPSAAMILAQHGADVIKVESPFRGGDWARGLGKRYDDHSAYSVYGTLGKRSIGLDLKLEAGREVLQRLIKGADVFIEGFKPGTIAKLGFDYESVRAIEPSILYFSISGFGQTGPLAGRPAMDPVLQSFCGITDENRGEYDNHPRRVAISMIDMYSGMLGVQALMAALYVRRETGQGRKIEVSLMQGGATLAVIRMIAGYLERNIGAQPMTSLPNGVFFLKDADLNITMVQPTDWPVFCDAIGQPALATDPRFEEPATRAANMVELKELLAPIFRELAYDWLTQRLNERGIMNARLNSYASFLEEEQVSATKIIAWLKQPGIPEAIPMPNIPGLPPFESGTRRGLAPVLGEQTTEILAEAGYDQAEIAALFANRTVVQNEPTG